MKEISDVVDLLANKLHNAGKITDKHEDKGFYERLSHIETQFPGAPVLVHTMGCLGPELTKLWTNSRLLDIVEQVLLDANPSMEGLVAGHPVWNIRSKTPNNPLATVPWQDTAYLAAGSENTLQPTAWIPLCDATAEMGTLRIIKRGHKVGRVLPHHLERGRKTKSSHSEKEGDSRSWYLYIKEKDLPEGERVVCEVPLGSFVLFNNIIPHCSGDNLSTQIRWSVDLRWQRDNQVSGFEGIKPLLPMRRFGDSELIPDFWDNWKEWASVNRNQLQKAKVAQSGQLFASQQQPQHQQQHPQQQEEEEEQTKDPFDSHVTGPWILRWSTNNE
jgi:ectoine hydroxylase-related dioxygenase (phytanoyl-CoA dioxygenase family)